MAKQSGNKRQAHLFGEAEPRRRSAVVAPVEPSPDQQRLARKLPRHIHLGTSSWSFPGWAGLVYDRGASKSALARSGLAAYAEHPLLRAVGIDRTYYAPIEAAAFAEYAAVVPDDFRFLVKAPADCTSPALRDESGRYGEVNPRFLDADYATRRIVEPVVEGLGSKVGTLLFQFPPLGRGWNNDVQRFADALGGFLEALPAGPPYSVELRDRKLFGEPYLAALDAGGARHCFNRHPRMPPIADQLRTAAPGRAGPTVVRWMLHSGQEYESAVERYEPFSRLVDEDRATRETLSELCADPGLTGFPIVIIANNKAEGSAPLTIFELARSIVRRLDETGGNLTRPVASKDDRRALVWVIVASQFGPPFMFSGVAVALPAIGIDLGAGATALGLIETLFLAGSVAFLLPIGRLAEGTDKIALYKLGLLGFAVSSVLIAMLSSMPVILCVRFLQGAASAIFAATGPAILADIVPAERRGKAYGSSLGAIYAGLTLGPVCAGVLINLWGWRSVFLFGAGLLTLGYLFMQRLAPSAWHRPTRSVHLPSAVLVVVAALSLVAGSATIGRGTIGYLMLGAGSLLAAGFVVLQRRLTHPLVDVDALIGNFALRSALSVQLLLYMNAFSSIFMLSIYMQVSLDRSAATTGRVLAIGSVIMALMAPVAGRLADRYRPRTISSYGVTAVLLATLLAVTLDDRSGLGPVIAVLAIQGLGFALFSSPNQTIIMNSVPADSVSMASALGATARTIGMLAGMLVTALLISRSIGNDPIDQHPLTFVGTMRTAFWVLAALSVVALGLSLTTRIRARG